MSKKLVSNAVDMLDNLALDIAGNIFSGNNERALVYLKAQMDLLLALKANMQTQNDVRADVAFETAIKEINTHLFDKLDNHYPMDMTKTDETMSTYAKAGFEINSYLKSPSEVIKGLTPEAEEFIKSSMRKTVI